MAQRAPSLAAAEAFLAAARNESFQAAAEDIALSPSAFSRRIQALEAFVGTPLFDRSTGRPRLTQAGAQFLKDVEPALQTITRAIADLRGREQGRTLRVVTSHTLALSWLMPRLGRLYAESGLELDLRAGRGVHHLRSGEIDVAIWGSPDDAGDYPHEPLEPLDAVPAVSAVDRQPRPETLAALAESRLLKARSAAHLWPHWLERVGYTGRAAAYAEFDTTHFVYESAASGLGVALAVPFLVDRFMREERLKPCPFRAPAGVQYSLISASTAVRRRPEYRLFRGWLLKEMEESQRTFDQWCAGAAA
jgi:LysR family transcriptional regulator, glycine cleavage system transcriptional activator